MIVKLVLFNVSLQKYIFNFLEQANENLEET